MSVIDSEMPNPAPTHPVAAKSDSAAATARFPGLRKNGKTWHEQKKAFRPTAGLTPYEKRKEMDAQRKATKAHEQEMKDEKEAERNRRIQAIKDRRKAKEEKERFERMAEKMHAKRVERRKRREKRNKLLNS